MKKGKKLIIALAVIAVIVGGIAFGGIKAYNHRSVPASVIQYECTNAHIMPKGQTLVSAHRSGGGIMPEESLMAFKNCVESEDFYTDVFEFDLHITKDGVLVLLHDDTLDRTSDCEAVFGETEVRPEDKTYEELRQLNMGADFTDENGNKPYADLSGEDVPEELRIQRVENILDYLSANGDFDYIIEIKNGGELGCRGVDALYTALSERDLLSKTVFGSFHGEVSKYLDDNYPDMLRSASITEVLACYFASISGIDIEMNYAALQVPFRMVGFNLGTARFINYAHEHNVAVQYWTINDADDAEYLASIGADCIMSDYPDIIYKRLKGE